MNGHTSSQIFFTRFFLLVTPLLEVLTSLRSSRSETMRRTALELQLIWMFYFIHELIPEFFQIYKVTKQQSDIY